MKRDKILIILIIIIILCIGGIIGVMLYISSMKDNEEDEIWNFREGGAEFTIDELNNITIEITNLDNNIKNKINYNKFYTSMKEYIYKNGLIQASKAECIYSNQNDNKFTLQFRLNDNNKTILNVIINTDDYNYEFSDNY